MMNETEEKRYNEYVEEVKKEFSKRVRSATQQEIEEYFQEEEIIKILKSEYIDYSMGGSTTPLSTACCLSMIY